jgi:integrase/recombinase XerD
LIQNSEGQKQTTKRFKYTLLKTFFNFFKSTVDQTFVNPCESTILSKTFRLAKGRQWTILEKDVVDEIIFKTDNPRDRLMLELMARGGMRIGEVLKLRAKDVDDRKLFIASPKSGRQSEIVFIPKKVADRLKDYIRSRGLIPEQRVFPLGYTGAREIVKKAGRLVGIDLRPHDLRRHAATYASRAGAPLEIVSKVILRHSNLSTTQLYLGKVSDTEAIRWIENIYG